MAFNDNEQNVYFESIRRGKTCVSFSLFLDSLRDSTGRAICPAPTTSSKMANIEWESPWDLLYQVLHILFTILPALFSFSLARVFTQLSPSSLRTNAALRFFVEFIVITIPTVFCINVANNIVEYIVALMLILICCLVWKTKCIEKAKDRIYTIGSRPRMLTLGRATINFLTAFCILAIDFDTFPRDFRKTRRYGAGLMDTGIGLFVFAMGSVSRSPQRPKDMWRMLRIVVPLIILGIARTVIIVTIGYEQDSHEYGKHLNAFFTLGLTKLFGTLVSTVAREKKHLFALGWGILILHEFTLQIGIAKYVMDDNVERVNIIDSNREGLCSLPGFIGIFILSMYLGKIWQTTELPLKFKEFTQKMREMSLVCATFWALTILSIFTVGIARVTCNFGYAVWTLGIASLMVFLFMIMFDFILDTLWPTEPAISSAIVDGGEAAMLLKPSKPSKQLSFSLPSLIEAVNLNGLVFFLVANVLTGGVNIFLNPDNRSNIEGYVILCLYMFLSTALVFCLFYRNIRIG